MNALKAKTLILCFFLQLCGHPLGAVKFRTSDGEREITGQNLKNIMASLTLKNLLKDVVEDAPAEIPLPQVSTASLVLLLGLFESGHNDALMQPFDPSDEAHTEQCDYIAHWLKFAANTNPEGLLELLSAVNFLDIPGLIPGIARAVVQIDARIKTGDWYNFFGAVPKELWREILRQYHLVHGGKDFPIPKQDQGMDRVQKEILVQLAAEIHKVKLPGTFIARELRQHGISNGKRFALGGFHTAMLTPEGKIFTWGRGAFGQLGLGDRV